MNTTKLSAYLGDPTLKTFVLAQLAEHRRLDHLIKGMYGDGTGADFHGCDVGCTLEAVAARNGKWAKGIDHSNHTLYPTELGIPEELAHLFDVIFEGLPMPEHLDWPVAHMEAITPGADLSEVWPHFAVALLTDPTGPVWPLVQAPEWATQRAAITQVADCFRRHATPKEFAAASAAASGTASAAARWTAGAASWASEAASRAAYRWQRDLLLRLLREAR